MGAYREEGNEMINRYLLALVAGIILVAIAGGPAAAGKVAPIPEGGLVGATWVTNIAAGQYFGLTIFKLRPRQAGWFIEGKFGRRMTYESSDYYENISISEAEGWGDSFLKEDESYDTFDVGLTFAYTNAFALYLGIGLSEVDSYRQYHDDFGILGDNGDYWIDGSMNGTKMNTVGGAIIRTSDTVLLQIGCDSQPKGLNIGVGITTNWP